ncbi:MAG: hypothetical protein U9R48_03375 [Chloroflexota bacterium]|nr:hypothetical protein [Chloroflexota bacterium]
MERWLYQSELSQITGVVVPAYFSAKPSDAMVRNLLWMTLGDCHHYVPLHHVVTVVDGDERTARLVREIRDALATQHGEAFRTLILPENGGKLLAIKKGVSHLLNAEPALEYFVIRDGDGDHDMSEVPSLVRTASYLAEAHNSSRVIAIGSRRSRHHPMGWVRGELETLLDSVTLDALTYHLARSGRAMNLSNCLGKAQVPDLSSGFKVYGKGIARELFVEQKPQMTCLSPEDYWHYGPETVTIVEAILRGAIIGEKLRLTWDGQPATSFGEFKYVSLYGELLAWVYTRLDIPLKAAAQFYDNYAAHALLRTTSEGRELLAAVRRYALKKVIAYRRLSQPVPEAKPILPFL